VIFKYLFYQRAKIFRKMKIISPLYDGGFKYLIENDKFVKCTLSIILETKVERAALAE